MGRVFDGHILTWDGVEACCATLESFKGRWRASDEQCDAPMGGEQDRGSRPALKDAHDRAA
jgi:hypothetical protein